MAHDFDEWFRENTPEYIHNQFYYENVTYSKQFVKDAWYDGYNEANEWHYVKDGDFPKDKTEKKYIVALKSEYGGFFYETDIWCESLRCFASNNPTKVYA